MLPAAACLRPRGALGSRFLYCLPLSFQGRRGGPQPRSWLLMRCRCGRCGRGHAARVFGGARTGSANRRRRSFAALPKARCGGREPPLRAREGRSPRGGLAGCALPACSPYPCSRVARLVFCLDDEPHGTQGALSPPFSAKSPIDGSARPAPFPVAMYPPVPLRALLPCGAAQQQQQQLCRAVCVRRGSLLSWLTRLTTLDFIKRASGAGTAAGAARRCASAPARRRGAFRFPSPLALQRVHTIDCAASPCGRPRRKPPLAAGQAVLSLPVAAARRCLTPLTASVPHCC